MVARDLEYHFLAAAELGFVDAELLDRPTALFGIHRIHAVERMGEQGRFFAARAAADFHNNVFIVIGVFWEHKHFELALQPRDVGLGLR